MNPADAQQKTTATDASALDLHALFDQIAEKIIEQQENIIGPVAIQQAKRVKELKIDWPKHSRCLAKSTAQLALRA